MENDYMTIIRVLGMLVGLFITLISLQTYKQTNTSAWRNLTSGGLVLGAWSVLSLIFQDQIYVGAIDALGIALFSCLISIAAIKFINEDLPVETLDHITPKTIGLFFTLSAGFTALLGILVYEIALELITLFYILSILFILPGIYGFYKLASSTGLLSWKSIFTGNVLILGSIVLNIYSIIVCGSEEAGHNLCNYYDYSFASIGSLPVLEELLIVSLISPLVMITGIGFFALGTLLLHKNIYMKYKEEEIGTNHVDSFISSVVDEIGSIIGIELARTMTKRSLEKEGYELKLEKENISVEDEITIEEAKSLLIEEFRNNIGPVAERKINNIELKE